MNWELPDVQAEFRKGRGTRDQNANICWTLGKAREFQKYNYFCFIDYAKALTVWMQVKNQQLEPDMEQKTSSKLGKEYVKAIYCHPTYLTYMQSTSCEMPGWMKHKLESRLLGEISITSAMQMTPPLWQKVKN